MQEILHRTEIALGRIRHCGYTKCMTNILANHLSGRKHVTDSASAARRLIVGGGGAAQPAQSATWRYAFFDFFLARYTVPHFGSVVRPCHHDLDLDQWHWNVRPWNSTESYVHDMGTVARIGISTFHSSWLISPNAWKRYVDKACYIYYGEWLCKILAINCSYYPVTIIWYKWTLGIQCRIICWAHNL